MIACDFDRECVRESVVNNKRASEDARLLFILKVGAKGFEPSTSRSRTERSTRLSHAPKTALNRDEMNKTAEKEGASY